MMLSNAPQPQLITVMPVGMDPRKLSVFRMAFRMHHSHQLYQLLDEAPGHAPDLAIVDVDSVDGWNAWHDFRASHPHLPALIVTTTPPRAGEAPAAVLRKPVRIETLFPQMRELLANDRTPAIRLSTAVSQAAQVAAVTPAAVVVPASSASSASSASPVSAASDHSAAAAYVASVAPTLDEVITLSQQAHRAAAAAQQQQQSPAPSDLPQLMDLPDPVPEAEHSADTATAEVVRSMLPEGQSSPASAGGKISFERFDPSAGLFGLVARLLRQRTAAVIRVREVPVLVLLPAQDKALLLQPLETLQPLCSAPSHEVDQQPYANSAVTPSPLEIRPQTLAWQLAIWTCRGRLMRGIATDTPIRLRYWPNLTRLPPIPEAMRITAFLTRTPVNLKLITRLLKVPPEDLFNYLAAAYGIGILDLPSRSPQLSVISTEPVRPGGKVETVAAPSSPQNSSPAPAPSPAKPAQSSGRLLSRLLKKVIGL